METEEIERRVKRLLVQKLDIDVREVQETSLLVKDLGIDSFGGIQILFDLKEEFDIEIPIEDMKKMESVGDVVRYIRSNLKKLNLH